MHEWSFPFSRSRLTSVKPSFHLSTSFLPSSPPSSSSSLSLSLYLLFLLFLLPFLLLRLLSYILTVSLGPLYYSIPLTLSLFSKFLYVLLSFNFSLTLLLSLPLTLPLCPPKNIRTSHHGMALMESMDCASRLRLKLGSFVRAMKYQPHFEASSLLESWICVLSALVLPLVQNCFLWTRKKRKNIKRRKIKQHFYMSRWSEKKQAQHA